jgi:hypothetical protein
MQRMEKVPRVLVTRTNSISSSGVEVKHPAPIAAYVSCSAACVRGYLRSAFPH